WPLSKEKLLAAHQIIQKELEQGHLEHSHSPWNTPIFIIQKKDKTKFRLLHDLREVNSRMEDMGALQPGLPLPSVIPLDWPVVVMDIKDCFFSIPLASQDHERFAFTVPFLNLSEPAQRYQWKVLPQGMKNSPTICQIAVARVLKPLRQMFPQAIIIHYMDDLLIAATSSTQVDAAEREVVQQLAEAGLYIQDAKTQRGDYSVVYLGTRITQSAVTPQLLQFNVQVKTLHDVQKLVGSIQWLRNLIGIPNELLLPLFELL
ncbi:hypothetical protein N321_02978, partial [Antrostomus carolinensis]